MGMFDEIVCEFPLPGDPPPFARQPGHRFQTKDLDCTLSLYTIRPDGRFVGPDADGFTGTVEFYTSNIVGSGPGTYTRSGEDAETVEYAATFAAGALTDIRQTERTTGPALPASKMGSVTRPRPTSEQIAEWKRREAEPLMGRTVYVLWGGTDDGYSATVVAESGRKMCVVLADGELELLDRRDRDHIFFDSEADARENRRAAREPWDRDKHEWDEYARRWAEKRPAVAAE